METKRISFLNQVDEKLVGEFHPAQKNSRKGVVFGHCFTCSRHTRIIIDAAVKLSKSGIAALRFDFSGNGQSEGDFAETTYSKHIAEMEAAIAWMKDNGFDTIGLAGHSMGAALALMTAAQLPDEVQAVSTLAGRYTKINTENLLNDANRQALAQNGRIDFVSRRRSLSLNAAFFEDAKCHDLQSIVAGLKQPLLAIHGDQDEIIPVSEVFQSEILKPEKTEIFVVEDADHMFSNEEHRNLIADRISDWFQEHLQ